MRANFVYLNPSEAALVLCVDEKSQIQALDGRRGPEPQLRAIGNKGDSDRRREPA